MPGVAVLSMTSAACRLQERGFPDINIITEKVAFQGITRFEDRGRLPLGSNFNVTSFSARILSQAAYNPKAWLLHIFAVCSGVQRHRMPSCAR